MNNHIPKRLLILPLLLLLPLPAWALYERNVPLMLTDHWVGFTALAVFALAYGLVVAEEFIQLRKSKPVMLAAGIIWALIAWVYGQQDISLEAEHAVRDNLLQYAELMLFLLVVMTYVNALNERRVFLWLREWFAHQGLSYRQLFRVACGMAFILSPFLDNLATALLMGSVVLALGEGNPRFIALSCVGIVVAANAGGVFSPFGDITTLMVWQEAIHTPQGTVDFSSFFRLALPSLVAFLVPAAALQFALPEGGLRPSGHQTHMRRGAVGVMVLLVASILVTILFRDLLHLPAVVGMMTGLSFLQFYGYYLKKTHRAPESAAIMDERLGGPVPLDGENPFDVFARVARAEWDTLLFLYGVTLCVGGLQLLGYLSLLGDVLYLDFGPTLANLGAALVSSVIENIPTMLMVLSMQPDMSLGQWLLVTFSTGAGGSLLSIGSAAGIALMGISQGRYTFFVHLRWLPAILAGFAMGAALHLWLNAGIF